MIYEFVTPSDPITFECDNDKIAFTCAVIIGSGKAGCHRYEKGKDISIPSLMLFDKEPEKTIAEYLGCDISKFTDDNHEKIASGMKSFAYGSIEERVQYDEAIEAITDPDKLEKFKASHEDRNRTSLSKWVAYAWQMGEGMEKKYSTVS